MEQNVINELVKQAAKGDQGALEQVLVSVQDMVFNLSLRMLGTVADAEDASQDILVRIITRLSGFRGDAQFSTWVYRLAANYLIDYKKSMFANQPLDFEFYGYDIENGCVDSTWKAVSEEEEERLTEELKYSCTNVMLQCLDPETRCVFILGTMFKVDSRLAGEILGMSPENYRQKLSRARRKVGAFLAKYCGLTKTGMCSCQKRIPYAVSQKRLCPERLEYAALKTAEKEKILGFKKEMEHLDELSLVFEDLPAWNSTVDAKVFLEKLLQSNSFQTIQES